MKIVEFQHIQSGIRKLAAVKETLEHLQEAYKDIVGYLTEGIIAQGSGVTLLYGCVNSGVLPAYNITAGAVYYAGEIYEVPAFSGTATGANVPVLSLNTTYRAGDPALYKKADGTNESINTHSIRKLLWSFAPSGSGIADFSALVTIKSRVSTLLSGVFAPVNSPTLTGIPAAPTPINSTNTTQIATTAFVKAVIADLVASSPATLDTLNELAVALGNDPNFATTMTNALAGKVAKAGDTMTGTLTIPNGTVSGHAVNKGQLDALDTRVGAAELRISALDIDSGWLNVTVFKTGISGSGVQYRKFGNRVYLRGTITITYATWVVADGWFDLPLAYAPAVTVEFGNTQVNDGALPGIAVLTEVRTTGLVTGGTVGGTAFTTATIRLGGISFFGT